MRVTIRTILNVTVLATWFHCAEPLPTYQQLLFGLLIGSAVHDLLSKLLKIKQVMTGRPVAAKALFED